MVHLCGLCLRMLMCANNTAHSGGPVWGAKAMNSHRTEQIVLSVSAGWIWRFEVCCRQSGNVSSQTITSGYTRRKTESLSRHANFMASPPPCHPLTGVFALIITSALTLCLPSSSLPVSNSNQSVGQSSGGGGGKWVCPPRQTVASTPSTSLLLASNFLGDFSSYFNCLPLGKYYIICLFD